MVILYSLLEKKIKIGIDSKGKQKTTSHNYRELNTPCSKPDITYIENSVGTKYVTLSVVQAHWTFVRSLTNISRKHDAALSYANLNRLKYTSNSGYSYEFLASWGHEDVSRGRFRRQK